MVESERKLWREVLEQAYEDAELRSVGEEPGYEPLDCERARRYLRADTPYESENLKLLCEFADVPADRVIWWARKRYPVREAIEGQSGCGSLAAAFSAVPLPGLEERELGSRTPQIAA
jgi:hypothetical protein